MKDFNAYIKFMEKSIQDKLFFLDKIDLSSFDYTLDFGCANGVLINTICDDYKNVKFIGYDKSEKMINLAKNTQKENTFFCTDFDKIKNQLTNKKYVIIFSSVLHELAQSDYDFVLSTMQNSSAVVIRDMYFDKTQNCAFDTKILKNYDKNDYFVLNFEQKYGKIDNLLNLYHYFLKYTYTQTNNLTLSIKLFENSKLQ